MIWYNYTSDQWGTMLDTDWGSFLSFPVSIIKPVINQGIPGLICSGKFG